ncbi:hypothetical protein O181_039412 [Austropuccinia psidii MF-1]|uniref:Uncharacterized protein n=1 Tax=Austropuccinia psidii MF-1 TaxID=1389203 RepID=A0A9Q3DGR8_9BASI|nr:hypothetical protein [Austropuccinia psidii MF-1]
MSGSTRLRKATANDADAKPLSSKEVYLLLNSLRSEVSSLKSAQNSDTAEMQLLQMAFSPCRTPRNRERSPLHMTNSCRNCIGRQTDLIILYTMDQILPSGWQA